MRKILLIFVLVLMAISPINTFASELEIYEPSLGNNLQDKYENGYTGQGIKIAILDTGVDIKNTDIQYVKAENFTNESDYTDGNGHGTKIAGIIGASKNDSNSVGVAYDSELYIAKVADSNGNVSYSDLNKGLEWAIAEDVDIINISLELDDSDSQFEELAKKASEKNIIIVASSGTLQPDGEIYKAYPAQLNTVYSVGMLNLDGKVYDQEFNEKKVDIWAPGENLTSSYFDNTITMDTGASFATAYASGQLALIMSEDSTLTSEEVIAKYNSIIEPAPRFYKAAIICSAFLILIILTLGIFKVKKKK